MPRFLLEVITTVIYLFNSDKKTNSTKLPPISTTANYHGTTATLKGPCSIARPVLKLDMSKAAEAGHPTRFNMCQIPEYNRYYFITDWEVDGPHWIAHCECDVLASFKSEIGETRQYVLRSSAAYNPYISDSLYPATSDVYHRHYYARWLDCTADYSDGTYCLAVSSDAASNMGTGTTVFYLVNRSGMNELMNMLFSTVDWLNISDVSQELSKALINPLQYISSCTLLPISFSSLSASNILSAWTKPIKIGWWNFTTVSDVYVCTSYEYIYQSWMSYTIPAHPQYSVKRKYLNLSPYARYILDLPFYGELQLDPAELEGFTHLHVRLEIDITTGKGMYKLFRANTSDTTNSNSLVWFARVDMDCGVSQRLTQVTTDVLGTIGGVVNATAGTAGAVISGDFGGAISNATSGIINAVNCATPRATSIGSPGSVIHNEMGSVLRGEFYTIVDTADHLLGCPYCKEALIRDIPGYIMCMDAKIGFKRATAAEQDKIREFMNGGFHYE